MNRHRSRLAMAATAVLVAALIVGVHPGTAHADERKAFVCAERACLFVLEPITDRDGDGVTDVDEEAHGSDPDDPASTPSTGVLIANLLERRLPSFERRFTELVLLPTLMPDGTAIETGLGEFKLRDGDGDLLKSIGVAITEIVDRNGFEAAFGLKLSGLKPGTGAETPPKYPFDKPDLIAHVDAALYSSGTVADLRALGANAGKEMTGETLGTEDRPFLTFGNNGESGVTKTYTVNYSDGSKDRVTHSYVKEPDGSKTYEKSVMSYNKDGDPVSVVKVTGSMWADADGTKHTQVTYNAPLKDAEGNVVGDKEVKIHLVEKPDGSAKVTTTTTTTPDEGKPTVETQEKVLKPPTDDGKEDEEYVDPEYIGFDIVTPEDWARLEFRIKQISLPAPGGDGGAPLPEQPPNPDQCTKCGADGTMVLIDPDGVVVVAAGGEPNFNKILQPDYDEWIQVMSGITGAPVPATDTGSPPGGGGTGGGSTGGSGGPGDPIGPGGGRS